jgi:hypothetical protein
MNAATSSTFLQRLVIWGVCAVSCGAASVGLISLTMPDPRLVFSSSEWIENAAIQDGQDRSELQRVSYSGREKPSAYALNYLDRLCPSLSEDEAALLLSQQGDSAAHQAVLIALSARPQLDVLAALAKSAPDDATVQTLWAMSGGRAEADQVKVVRELSSGSAAFAELIVMTRAAVAAGDEQRITELMQPFNSVPSCGTAIERVTQQLTDMLVMAGRDRTAATARVMAYCARAEAAALAGLQAELREHYLSEPGKETALAKAELQIARRVGGHPYAEVRQICAGLRREMELLRSLSYKLTGESTDDADCAGLLWRGLSRLLLAWQR